MEAISALRKAIEAGHQELEEATQRVESLESKLDYQEQQKINPGPPRFQAEQPGKDKQMIMFDEDCDIKVTDCQVQEMKNALAIILGNAELLMRLGNLAEQDKEGLRGIEKAVWGINNILSQEEKENEA